MKTGKGYGVILGYKKVKTSKSTLNFTSVLVKVEIEFYSLKTNIFQNFENPARCPVETYKLYSGIRSRCMNSIVHHRQHKAHYMRVLLQVPFYSCWDIKLYLQ